jgi:hypothetical protein
MFKRLSAVAVVTLIAVLTAVGIGAAAVPGATTTTSTSAPAATSTSAAPGGGNNAVVYQIEDAGTVTVGNSGSALTVVSADPADGWTVEIEAATGVEVEVDFRNGTRRVQFNAELEDGQVRVRVRERTTDRTGEDSTTTSMPGSSTTMPTTTSIPDTSTSMPTGGDFTTTYNAGDAGTVTVTSNGTTLTILAAVPAQGWSVEIETASGIEVEVDFRNGTRRIQFSAELEDGAVKVKLRDGVSDDAATNDEDSRHGDDRATRDDDNSRHGNNDDTVSNHNDDNDDNSRHDDDNSGRDDDTVTNGNDDNDDNGHSNSDDNGNDEDNDDDNNDDEYDSGH